MATSDRGETADHDIGPRPIVDFEYPVAKQFEPCSKFDYEHGRYCFSTERYVRIVPTNSGKKLVCGNGHNHPFEDNLFIPAYEFEPGGFFEDVLPDEFAPTDAELRTKRWKVPSHVEKFLNRATVCAHCRVPPFDAHHDNDVMHLFNWVSEFDEALLKKVHTELQAMPGVEANRWFLVLSVELRTEIVARAQMSLLHTDHGVPRKTGNHIWRRLRREARLFLRESFLFKLCRKCNGMKSWRLPEQDKLSDMYVETYYESYAAARAARVRWELLEEVLAAVYREASEAS